MLIKNIKIINKQKQKFYTNDTKSILKKVKISNLEPDKFINYERYLNNLNIIKTRLGKEKSLSLTDKLFISHLEDPKTQELIRGSTYLSLLPDRVAFQDATAQLSLLQFSSSGLPQSKIPTTVHCDHLTVASENYLKDLEKSNFENEEVYKFMEQSCLKFGIGFWKPNSGIIHQIILENYAYPGLLLLGADSHTPNLGGLSGLGIGVGGGDCLDIMCGLPFEIKYPNVIGIKLMGELNEWCSPKDVILNIVAKLGVNGGKNCVLEYFGPGVNNLSATGMATICNMGAECGATTSVFPYTKNTRDYLIATNRIEIANQSDYLQNKYSLFKRDINCEYDKIIELNLEELEPSLNGPFTPDLINSLSNIKNNIKNNKWPNKISASLIGSCTNSSYEDISKSSQIINQALKNNLKLKSPLYLSPGSEKIKKTLIDNNILESFEKIGAKILPNACGPCIGQWDRPKNNSENTIVTSYNRNFAGRNDGNTKTHTFLTSPEIVTAMAFSGNLDFNPVSDYLELDNGNKFKFEAPKSEKLPKSGYSIIKDNKNYYSNPLPKNNNMKIEYNSDSDRIQKFKKFKPFDFNNYKKIKLLIKVYGKCTTDHISRAGKWLKYRGHLSNISRNFMLGAINSFNSKPNLIYNILDNKYDEVYNVATKYEQNNINWMIIGDKNYGEGSAREHAAVQTRFLGGSVVLVKSFARIHEANLKKQGILPLTFKNEFDYDLINKENFEFELIGLNSIYNKFNENLPIDQCLKLRVYTNREDSFEIDVCHSMNNTQWGWLFSGGALNKLTQN